MERRASRRIAVVEAPDIRHFLQTLLDRFGYEAVELSTREALDLLATAPAAVEIVVTNRPAPLLNAGTTIPIVYLSSVPNPDEADRCAAVLRKPFHYRELLDTLNALLAAAECHSARV